MGISARRLAGSWPHRTPGGRGPRSRTRMVRVGVQIRSSETSKRSRGILSTTWASWTVVAAATSQDALTFARPATSRQPALGSGPCWPPCAATSTVLAVGATTPGQTVNGSDVCASAARLAVLNGGLRTNAESRVSCGAVMSLPGRQRRRNTGRSPRQHIRACPVRPCGTTHGRSAGSRRPRDLPPAAPRRD